MADLSGITELNFTGIIRGGYKEPVFEIQGVTELVKLEEILEWLDDNSGGGGGGVTIGGEFDDDTAAAAGGIPLNGFYTLSAASGFYGLVKKRLV